MAIILDGKKAAASYEQELKARIADLKEKGVVPKLAIVLVGDGKPSRMYASFLKKRGEAYSVPADIIQKDEETTEQEMEDLMVRLSRDPSISGVLMMMPLPSHLNAEKILSYLDPMKDLDGLTELNQGRFFAGKDSFQGGTPSAVMALLHFYQIPVEGKHAVVIGRSNVIGKPVSLMLLKENATVTICHSHTENLKEMTRNADIIVAAAGKPGMVTKDMVKPGAVVIDVGISRVNGKTVGDVEFDGVSAVAGAVTPVPGGVGAMTTVMMMANLVKAAEFMNNARKVKR
jgi:methylenetetrahydrofolate dehydrogenase (NADP+)/methenyltetrahydrofolate cyclohydrolase